MKIDGAETEMYKLILRASTRTGSGIAANQEIVLNYGVQYDVNMGNPWVDEQTKKKYKTTLETFFDKAAGLEDSASQSVSEAVTQPVPAKPSTGAPAPQPPVPAKPSSGAPAPQPVPKAVQGKMPATKALPVPSENTPILGAPPPKASPPTEANVLKQISDPPLELKLEEGRLVITTLSDAKRRLKPLTILCEFFKGKITPDAVPPEVPSFPFAVTLKSLILDAGSNTFKTVESLIKEKNLTQIYMYEPFPQSMPPKDLKPRASYLSALPCRLWACLYGFVLCSQVLPCLTARPSFVIFTKSWSPHRASSGWPGKWWCKGKKPFHSKSCFSMRSKWTCLHWIASSFLHSFFQKQSFPARAKSRWEATRPFERQLCLPLIASSSFLHSFSRRIAPHLRAGVQF